MDAYRARISGILRSLGIPEDYGALRSMALHEEAAETDLVVAGKSPDACDVRLSRPATQAWQQMRDAAADEQIVLLPWSGFRSVARQEAIIREKLSAGRPLADILRYVAAPGFSEHHTGRAIDIGAPDEPALEEGFGLTSAFIWLTANADRFGFTLSYPRGNSNGIGYEPWHWCWK